MAGRLTIALLLGALAFSPDLAVAEQAHSLEQLVIEMGHSRGEHEALAKHYRAKAAEARAEMKRHDDMARSYHGVKVAKRQQMEAHCKKLSQDFAAVAEDYEALAKLHEEQAKEAQ